MVAVDLRYLKAQNPSIGSLSSAKKIIGFLAGMDRNTSSRKLSVGPPHSQCSGDGLHLIAYVPVLDQPWKEDVVE